MVKNMKSRGNGEGRFGRHNEAAYTRARDIKLLLVGMVWECKKEIVAAVDAAWYTKQNMYVERKFLPHLYWNVPYTF